MRGSTKVASQTREVMRSRSCAKHFTPAIAGVYVATAGIPGNSGVIRSWKAGPPDVTEE
jgi:hypothetical protein